MLNIYKFVFEYFKRCKIPTKQEIQEYYPKYLLAHRHPINKLFHFCGNFFILGQCIAIIINSFHNPLWLVLLPFMVWFGIYSFAWFGHFVFEKNQPATFKVNPILTKICDWKMNYELLTFKIKWDTRNKEHLFDKVVEKMENFSERK